MTTATPAETAPDGAWMPAHSGRDAAAGVFWLPRLIDKGRRVLEGEAAGRDLLGDYLFGVNDPMDAQLLRFLDFDNEAVLLVLRREPDDGAAAAELVRRGGRTPEECAAWSSRARRLNSPFLAMIDADEDRRAPGVSTTLLKLVYNRVVMAPSYPVYRRAEARRLAGGAAPAPPGRFLAAGAVALAATAVALTLTGVAMRRRARPAASQAAPQPHSALQDEIALVRAWFR
ncbi:MAG TPA: DUF5069 domain-containing protein [Chloroflexota bacterium]|nr:DUF5069 domain-containing protein [Chloroflexota bacterium]